MTLPRPVPVCMVAWWHGVPLAWSAVWGRTCLGLQHLDLIIMLDHFCRMRLILESIRQFCPSLAHEDR